MAARIVVITDSTADLPPGMAQERGIYVIPLNIIWGRETLKDGVDISPDQFYRRLAADSELPKTSQPTPAEFEELYRRVHEVDKAEAVVVITISAELSGTYSSAEQAARAVDFPVYVVDSRTVSMALGLVVLKVAEARDEGVPLEQLVELARDLSTRSKIIFTVNTLEYLHRGGRIGGAKWLLGTALSIKPVLHVKEGRVDAMESVRTRRRALNRIVEIFGELVASSDACVAAVMHGDALDEAVALKAEIEARWKPQQVYFGPVGLAVGTHAGPGVIGFAVIQ